MNEMQRMQEYVARMNRESGAPIARGGWMGDVTDDEGFSRPAQSPPKEEVPGKDVPEVTLDPKKHLEEYQRRTYQPTISAIDLDSNLVISGYGSFPLSPEEAAYCAGVGLQAISRHFQTVIQTMAQKYNLTGDVLAVMEEGESTDATTPPGQVSNGAESVQKGTGSGGKRKRGRPTTLGTSLPTQEMRP